MSKYKTQSGNEECHSDQIAIGLGRFLLIGFLWLAVLASAVAVIYTTHITRQNFNELQNLKKYHNALQVEWGQLLLEQSTQAAQVRIERIAVDELQMIEPAIKTVVVVR